MTDGIDEEVFARCCECVYTGDYSVPYPAQGSSECDTSQPEGQETQYREEVKRWNPSHLTQNLFHPKVPPRRLDFLLEKLGHPRLSKSEKASSSNPSTSYAAAFLSHAEMHLFGVRTDWKHLIDLSNFRLLRELENFTLYSERTGDIVQLLEFVFEGAVYMECLETLLRDYIVWNLDMMMRNADFQRFLARNPSLEHRIFFSMWE
ncbi:hypothetical protein N7451_012794 [Penicillium sp. IBT 35674x]|nr:hypothetical protein N7451_012794 [Penicillium sp. IBT 35674x]